MGKGQPKVIIIILLLVTILLTILLLSNLKNDKNDEVGELENEIYTEKLKDGTKINVSKEFNKTKNYKGLEISNIQFTEKNGMSVLLADIKNLGNTRHEAEIVKITILGENGEKIAEISPVIGDVELGETIKLNASITADVTNAKDFKIEPKD